MGGAQAIASAGFDRVATEWWAWKSDWSAAKAYARQQLQLQRSANNTNSASSAAAAAAATAPSSSSVTRTATGTKPVIAGIAVKGLQPVAAANEQPFMPFNYGLFRQQPSA